MYVWVCVRVFVCTLVDVCLWAEGYKELNNFCIKRAIFPPLVFFFLFCAFSIPVLCLCPFTLVLGQVFRPPRHSIHSSGSEKYITHTQEGRKEGGRRKDRASLSQQENRGGDRHCLSATAE